jgi:predicted  nucleic acid-binding Zn-ribbon protein
MSEPGLDGPPDEGPPDEAADADEPASPLEADETLVQESDDTDALGSSEEEPQERAAPDDDGATATVVEAGEAPAVPDGPFGALLELQDLDTRIAQLQHRRDAMPERAQLREVHKALDTLAARAEILATERQLLTDQLSALEREGEALQTRQAGIERRLLESRGAAARDLQAMDHEVHRLAQRRSELDDQQLALMEDQEPVDAELDHLASDRARLDEAAASLSAALAVADAAADAELSTLAVTRGLRASEVPADLLTRYEAIRARLGGVGAARLVGNRCDGCHLELPSVEVERVRRLPPDEVVTCEQCGRILVRLPAAPRR